LVVALASRVKMERNLAAVVAVELEA